MIWTVIASLAIFVDGVQFYMNGTGDAKNWPFLEKKQFFLRPDCHKTQLPKLVQIGVGHSGSTLLANMMNEHPDLSFGLMKEHNYLWKFDGEKQNFLKKYREEFVLTCEKKIAFDSSPRLLFLGLADDIELAHTSIAKQYGPGVGAVNALWDLLGHDTLFLAMFRDPVPWAMSNGVPDVLDLSEVSNISEFRRNVLQSASEGNAQLRYDTTPKELASNTLLRGRFAKRGCYANSLEAWLKVVPRKNFLFLSSDDFFQNPQSTLDQVTDFVGVPRFVYEKEKPRGSGRRRNNKKPSWNTYKAFHENLQCRDCKQRLESMTGLKFEWGEIEDFNRQELD